MPEMAAGKHNLEEGDQLVLLNAFDVMAKNPQSILDIFFSRHRCVHSSVRPFSYASKVNYTLKKE